MTSMHRGMIAACASAFLAACLGLTLAPPALAATAAASTPTSPTSIGNFTAWTAWTAKDSTGLLCYVSAEPTSSKPAGVNRDPIHFLVVDRKGLGTKNEVQTLIGYPIKKGSTPTAAVDGKSYAMVADGSGAWLASAADENGFVAAMKAGKTLTVKGTSERGTDTVDTYSLSGVTAALTAAGKACS